MGLSLQEVVQDFAGGLKKADEKRPVEGSYEPGIGPHPEEKSYLLTLTTTQAAGVQ
jgi:hypothetical protein